MKHTITEKQRQQFNLMRNALRVIAKEYQTPTQLRKECANDYGLEFEETIEMAYENIQATAQNAVRGIKEISA